MKEAVAAPPAPKAQQPEPSQNAAPQRPDLSHKAIIYPDFQGVDNPDGAHSNSLTKLKVADCIGNEPGKDFNYFKTGSDAEKGPIKDYVEKIIKDARENGVDSFPPIKALRHPLLPGKYLVIDGNHRLGAFKIGGIPDIKAMMLDENNFVLAVPGTRYQQGIVMDTITLDQARKTGVDLKTYFTTRELVVPQNDEWVISLRMPVNNS